MSDNQFYRDAHAKEMTGDYSRDIDAMAKEIGEIDKLNGDLLKALEDEHKTIDIIMARLIELDPKFRPTQSAIWSSIVNGALTIAKAKAGAA